MNDRSFTVPASLDGERVDRSVALVTGWTRADVQELVAAGEVLVDGRTVTKSARLATGAVVEVRGEPPGPESIVGEPVPLDVRHEDPDVVVIAKPAGLVVHPGAGHHTGTLVHGLLHRYPEIAAVGDAARPGIVHRLDRDTSGLLMVARSERAYGALVEQLAARTVGRHYLALVWGTMPSNRGVIDAPIGRSQVRRTKMTVRDEGRDARTAYDVIEVFPEPSTSLVRCTLETGRTHQIRVHLDAVGHPVVGDPTYRGVRQSLPLDRPFLHAASLSFAHPATGEPLTFDDPLPPPLDEVLSSLRERGRSTPTAPA